MTSPKLWLRLSPKLNISLNLIQTRLLLRAPCSSKVFLAVQTSQAPNSYQNNSLMILNSTDDKGEAGELEITWSWARLSQSLPELSKSPNLRKQIILIAFIIIIMSVPSETPSDICFGLFLICLNELDSSPMPSLNRGIAGILKNSSSEFRLNCLCGHFEIHSSRAWIYPGARNCSVQNPGLSSKPLPSWP